MKRHPVIRKFAQRNPRLHGLIGLLLAGTFALFGWQTETPMPGVVLFLLALVFGAFGLGYVLFGSACSALEDRWENRFDPANVSWRQALAWATFGFATLALALALYRVTR